MKYPRWSQLWSWLARSAIIIVMFIAISACRPKPVPLPTGVHLENPLISENLETKTSKEGIEDFQQAWHEIEIGRLDEGEAALRKLSRQPEWERPVRVALGYAALLRNERSRAASMLRDVVSQDPGNVAALIGLAQIAESEARFEEAFGLYDKATSVDPSLAFAHMRRDITRLEAADFYSRQGADAAAAGKSTEAIASIEKALSLAPDRAELYLQLGELYLRLPDYPHAISNLQQAMDRAPQEASVKARLAEALFLNDNLEQAQQMYTELAEAEPRNSDYTTRLKMVEDAIKWKKVPPEFKEISSARLLTREALAALIALKVPEAIEDQTHPVDIAIDIGGWSRDYIVQVTRANLMDVYPGHLFAPREAVKRGEAALVCSRVIESLSTQFPGIRSSRLVFPISDISPNHVYYEAVQTCLLYGLFKLDDRNDFNPAYVLSGEEGVRLVDSLTHLVGR